MSYQNQHKIPNILYTWVKQQANNSDSFIRRDIYTAYLNWSLTVEDR